MRLLLRHIILITISISLFACSTNVKLIDNSRTKYGDIKFYAEKVSKNNSSVKRIYASVKTSDNQNYYSFYPDKIVKTSDTAKTLIYTVYYGQLQKNYDRNIYQTFSFLDSISMSLEGLSNILLTSERLPSSAFIINILYFPGISYLL